MDRDFGLMHIRLQTWLPFDIQICLNGREYLARQMARAGIGFEQRDNCFARIDDLPRAQRMMRRLEERKWAGLLGALARRVNPLPRRLNLFGYYWTVRESEYATDILFRDAASLGGDLPGAGGPCHASVQLSRCDQVPGPAHRQPVQRSGRRRHPRPCRGDADQTLDRRELDEDV